MQKFLKRTWAEINLDNLLYNYNEIRKATNPCAKIMSVIKADAYGHGALPVANELIKAGTDWFAVSNLDEALELRRNGIETPILILGYTPSEYANVLAFNNISQAVFNYEYGKNLSSHAKKNKVQVNIHLKLDTGMSRIGFSYQDNIENTNAIDEIEEICSLEGLYPEGIFTHFAKADEKGSGEVFTRIQYDLFIDAINRLSNRGVKFEYRHCCNSAGTEIYPEMHLDIVRPGIILYGLSPSKDLKNSLNLKPVMELKTVISMVKKVPKNTAVGYGGTFITDSEMTIATVPIGYADGYNRKLSNNSEMIVNGHKAPVIGRVCMDQTILDVSNIEGVKAGMKVTVFGKECNCETTIDSIADKVNTINYELVCDVGRRVPRVFIKNDKIVKISDYLK